MKMTEARFLEKLRALQKAKSLLDLERLLARYYGEKTQQHGRRGR